MEKTKQLLLMERHFEPGDELMREGDESSEFFLLKDGEVVVLKRGLKVGEVKGGEMQEFLGEVGALLRAPRIATVVAKTKCIVLAVPANQLEQVVVQAPTLGVKLARSLAQKLSGLMGSIGSHIS